MDSIGLGFCIIQIDLGSSKDWEDKANSLATMNDLKGNADSLDYGVNGEDRDDKDSEVDSVWVPQDES